MADSQWGIGPTLRAIQQWFSPTILPKQSDSEMPKVDQPAWWEPEPLVTGGKDFANEVYSFDKKYPRAKKTVKMVTIGPSSGSINAMIGSNLPPDKFSGTTLEGVYSPGTQSIGINPSLLPTDRSLTLGHEMGHALGISEDDLAEIFGNKWASEYRKKKLSPMEQSEVDSFKKDPLIPEMEY